MVYFRYEMIWNEYETSYTLKKNQKSEFEIAYDEPYLSNLNEEFLKEFLKKEDYVIWITGQTESCIELYVATTLKALEEREFEKKIVELFSDCTMTLRREVTIGEYKREVSSAEFRGSYNKIFRKLKIDYEARYYEPYPFQMTEQILESKKLSKTACKKRAKEILGSKDLHEEIDRIYSKENKKAYFGHPVQYMVSAGEWSAAQDIYELLIQALVSNKRLVSDRIVMLRKIERKAYNDECFEKIMTAAEGGVLVIELNNEESLGRFATDFHELTKKIGEIVKRQKKDTLFMFVEIMGKSLKDNDAINNILTKADFIQIKEGAGTKKQAEKYLAELTKKVDFPTDDENDAMQYLPEEESYSVTDIFNAYNAWYGSGLKNHVYKAYKEKSSFQVEITKVESKPYEELQEMVGLSEAKTVVNQIIAAAKVIRVRERMGLNTESSSLHMMFAGNPGTAKTSVARLLAKILKEEEAISSGKFVECGRQDLVGRYVGWTANIVEEKFKEARGGVLFIDEAYSLVDDSNTYGAEAINTITQLMENYRDEVIVIFAGYPDKMQEFLEQNEGLKSRIAFHLNFPDYSPEELTEILKLLAKKREYTLDVEALISCREIFEKATREENFGNGRYARNLLEQAILKQSSRIINGFVGKKLSKEEMCRLKKEDFQRLQQGSKKQMTRIGFTWREGA